MTQRFQARSWHVVYEVLCIAMVFLSTAGNLRSQEQSDQADRDSDAKPLPYRRVFIRETDVPSLALDGYQPLELSNLERLMALLSREQDRKDRYPTDGEPEINAFHAQAKLSGADLIAERSRILWRGDGFRNGQSQQQARRKTLSPWSPAIDISINKSASPPSPFSANAPNWLYDASGFPSVRPSGSEDWFSWSLRPQRDSTPNRLNFSFSFPRTPDSCLVIQLPKSARIVDSNVVVRAMDTWSDIVRRLGTWPVSAGSPETVPDLNASEVYWCLELSGQEQARFSIQLGTIRTALNEIDPTDPIAVPYTRLIAKQSTQHQFASEQLRTLCEWEWLEGASLERSVRLRVPEGFRLRSLTINDREANLQFAQRIVEASLPPPEGTRTTTATNNRIRMNAEFLADLDALQSIAPRFSIPPIEFLGSYVVSGTTAIIPQGALQLYDVSVSSGRLDTTRSAPGEGLRLDYSWFHSPPSITLQMSSKDRIDRAELLTKLSTDGPKAKAIVRMQLGPWHPGIPDRIRISPHWHLDSAQINSKSFSLKEDDSIGNGEQSLRLEPVGLAEDLPLQIELQLSRDMQTVFDGSLGIAPLIDLPGWDRIDALVMEPSYAMRLESVGNYVDEIAEEETLTPWQRERLPRLGKYLVFRMPDGRLPALRWRSDTRRAIAHVASDVRVRFHQWRVQHRIELSPSALLDKPIDILLEGAWRWDVSTPHGPRRIAVNQDASSGNWRFAPDELQADPSDTSTPILLIATQSFESFNAIESVTLPRIPSADTASRTLHLDPGLRVAVEDPEAHWEFDANGQRQLRWPSAAHDSGPIRIEVTEKPLATNREWVVSRSQLHLATDAQGSEKGLLIAELLSLDGTGFELPIHLPVDWSPQGATLRFRDAEAVEHTEVPATRRDGDLCIVQWRPTLRGGDATATSENVVNAKTVVLELMLQGPSLNLVDCWDYGVLSSRGFEFQWPEIRIPNAMLTPPQYLWAPNHLVLREPRPNARWDRVDLPDLKSWWSMWSWSHEIQLALGLASAANAPLHQRSEPPEALIPNWMAPNWALLEMRFEPSQPPFPNRTIILQNPHNTSIPALFFALWILGTPWLLRHQPWLCLMAAGISVLAGHWMPSEFAMAFRASMVGIGFGSFVYLAYGLYTSLDIRPKDRAPRNDRWSPWNEPSLASDQISENSGRPKTTLSACILMLLAFGFATFRSDTLLIPQHAHGQEAATRRVGLPDSTFDILIPLNEENAWISNTVYVPAEIAKILENTSDETALVDRDAYLISAKHSLRFDGRSIGFGNTEQPCIHTYEVWIGDLAVGRPLRIPFQSDRSRLNRFTIDGTEVAVSRFTKNDTELIWYPERSGRKILQIESQLRIRPTDRDRNPNGAPIGLLADTKPPRGWAIDVAILPAANATLEVETEGPWSADISSRGRVSNPLIGKYSIQLGGVDRVTGDLTSVTTSGQRPFAVTTSDSVPMGTSDSPQMNTELYIDREQLLARTIIEYTRGAESLGEIEIESDIKWQPVGSVWGDAQLVDVRPGSTLDRRRYIVRWNSDAAPSEGISNGPGIKRSITTTWIPVGDANVRNILFAECRDRRVRQGTLRYARASGSVWTLDGVSSWIPSINTRERIEWNELVERPIATSLKIPLSGGFGVLRKQLDTSVQRARVTHQWLLESSRVNLKSKVELSSPINTRSAFLLKLPPSYKAIKATARNNAIPFIQWSEGSATTVQLFIDRDNGELNEIILNSEIPLAGSDVQTLPLPTMEIIPVSVIQQFAEISAEPMWKVETPGDTLHPVLGQGPSRVLASVPLSIDSPPMTIRAMKLSEPWTGNLIARAIALSDDGTVWELRYSGNAPENPRPTFALSIPVEIAKQWKSDASIRELTELQPGRKLLVVQPKWNEELQQYELSMELTTNAGIRIDADWIEKIHPVAQPELQCKLSGDASKEEALQSGPHEELDSNPSERLHGGAQISVLNPPLPLAIHELKGRIGTDQANTAEDRWLLHSTFWIYAKPDEALSLSSLEWTLSPNARCEWAMVNGERVGIRQEKQLLELDFVPAGYPLQVEIVTTWTVPSTTLSATIVQDYIPVWHGGAGVPTLFALSDELRNSRTLSSLPPLESDSLNVWCARTRASLASLETIQANTAETDLSANPSDPRARWLRFFAVQSAEGLRALSMLSGESTSHCYGQAAEQAKWIADSRREWQQQSIRPNASDRFSWFESSPNETLPVAESASRTSLDWTKDSFSFADWLMHHRDRLISTLCMGLVLVMAVWLRQAIKPWLQRSPWWQLGIMGGLIWLLTGNLIPAVILLVIGLFLAIDTYRMVNERFRQSGTRALR